MKPRLFSELKPGDTFSKSGVMYRKTGSGTAVSVDDNSECSFKSSAVVLSNVEKTTGETKGNALDFYSVAVGQAFIHNGNLYCKEDFRSARLLRWASGDRPSKRTTHTFVPESVVQVE